MCGGCGTAGAEDGIGKLITSSFADGESLRSADGLKSAGAIGSQAIFGRRLREKAL